MQRSSSMSPELGATHRLVALVALVAFVFVGGCGSTGTGQEGLLDTPLLTVTSDSAALEVAVFSNPQPPVRGNLLFRYRITDASGAPVDGLSLEVKPWMPAMGHGASVTPTVTARGSGEYDLSNVYLVMAGQWQLQTTITGGASDHAAPEFMVR